VRCNAVDFLGVGPDTLWRAFLEPGRWQRPHCIS
jgi:hypothetical protein